MRLFLGKQLIWRAIAAGVIAGGVLAAQPVLAADDLPVVDDIPVPSPRVMEYEAPPPRYYAPAPYAQRPYAPGVYGRDAYAAMPPVRIERSALYGRPVLPPYQVFAILRSSGYSPLGHVTRRGWIYTIAAMGPRGDDGRLIIDARTGRIMRFIPALAVDERLNAEVAAYGGPPGPPLYQQDYRRPPRPPVPVPRGAQSGARGAAPKVASRAPSTAPLPAAQPDNAAGTAKPAVTPAQQPAEAPPAVTPAEKTAEVKSAATAGAAAPPASQPSASPQPSALKLWPTQAMPPVQTLD
jgi:hypothetical protein